MFKYYLKENKNNNINPIQPNRYIKYSKNLNLIEPPNISFSNNFNGGYNVSADTNYSRILLKNLNIPIYDILKKYQDILFTYKIDRITYHSDSKYVDKVLLLENNSELLILRMFPFFHYIMKKIYYDVYVDLDLEIDYDFLNINLLNLKLPEYFLTDNISNLINLYEGNENIDFYNFLPSIITFDFKKTLELFNKIIYDNDIYNNLESIKNNITGANLTIEELIIFFKLLERYSDIIIDYNEGLRPIEYSKYLEDDIILKISNTYLKINEILEHYKDRNILEYYKDLIKKAINNNYDFGLDSRYYLLIEFDNNIMLNGNIVNINNIADIDIINSMDQIKNILSSSLETRKVYLYIYILIFDIINNIKQNNIQQNNIQQNNIQQNNIQQNNIQQTIPLDIYMEELSKLFKLVNNTTNINKDIIISLLFSNEKTKIVFVKEEIKSDIEKIIENDDLIKTDNTLYIYKLQ